MWLLFFECLKIIESSTFNEFTMAFDVVTAPLKKLQPPSFQNFALTAPPPP